MPLTIHTDLDDPAAEKVLSARGTLLFAASVNAQPEATRQISAEAAEIIEAGKKGAKERAAGRLAAKQATPRTIQALINARVAEAAEIRKRSPSTSPAAPSGKNLSTVSEDAARASNRFNSTYQLPSGQKVMVRGPWSKKLLLSQSHFCALCDSRQFNFTGKNLPPTPKDAEGLVEAGTYDHVYAPSSPWASVAPVS